MATTKPKIEYPSNLKVQGILTFPIYSEADIVALKEWRERKGHKPPQFPDKIGATLLLNQANYDKAFEYLTETYLPFVDVLYKETDGEKGIEPELVAGLLEQAKQKIWIDPTDKKKRPNMPLRDLGPKDKENVPEGFEAVAKIKFSGPYQANIGKKAIVRGSDGKQSFVTIQDLIDDEVIPETRRKVDSLWWGAGWHHRVSLRFNAFDSASVGVTAYSAPNIYLLPQLGLPASAGNEAELLEEGDEDWADE
jgi:hypothetical protein